MNTATTIRVGSDPRTGLVESVRPWGGFRQFALNTNATVKVITVEPGCRLSLQRHADRGELWSVLDGPVTVTVDDATWTADTGEDVWVPQGAVHRLGNPGLERVRVLEVAFGRFAEDDIERLEDDYARD